MADPIPFGKNFISPAAIGGIGAAVILAAYVLILPVACRQFGYVTLDLRTGKNVRSFIVGPKESNEVAPDWLNAAYTPLMYVAVWIPPFGHSLGAYCDLWNLTYGLHIAPHDGGEER